LDEPALVEVESADESDDTVLNIEVERDAISESLEVAWVESAADNAESVDASDDVAADDSNAMPEFLAETMEDSALDSGM
jgi:hypothetical protein